MNLTKAKINIVEVDSLSVSGIYAIINKINDKMYIGSAVNIGERWTKHRYQLNKGCHVNNYLQNSWNKYGSENFQFAVLEVTEDRQEREQFFIDSYNPIAPDGGYNILRQAYNSTGYTHTEEARKKMSDRMTGWKMPDAHKKAISESSKGEGNHFSSLTENKVLEIVSLLKNGISQYDIAEKIGCTVTNVNQIKNGNTWAYLTGGAIDVPKVHAKLTEEKVVSIVEMIKSGKSVRNIAEMYGVSKGAISAIKGGQSWTQVTGGEVTGGKSLKHIDLTENDIDEIKSRNKNGESMRSIAKDYDISYNSVRNIIKGLSRW